MKRTQVYLPEEDVRRIELFAMQNDVSKAKVIREVVRKGLKLVDDDMAKKLNAGEALSMIAKIKGEGPKDLAENMDEYLYGKKSEYAG